MWEVEACVGDAWMGYGWRRCGGYARGHRRYGGEAGRCIGMAGQHWDYTEFCR